MRLLVIILLGFLLKVGHSYNDTSITFGSVYLESGGHGAIALGWRDASEWNVVFRERFIYSPFGENVGLDFDFLTFDYKGGDIDLVSLNPLFFMSSFMVGMFGDCCYESKFRFHNNGVFSTLLLSPQILTNWAIRVDVLPKVLGLYFGPKTTLYAPQWVLDFKGKAGVYISKYGIDLEVFSYFSNLQKFEYKNVNFFIGKAF